MPTRCFPEPFPTARSLACSTVRVACRGQLGKRLPCTLQPGANRQQADERLRLTLERFGFIYPREVANWSGPTPQGPLGIVRGNVVNDLLGFEVETANLGCASCHAGRLYDAQGDPTSAVWLGAPNTSLDLDAYGDAVYLDDPATGEASATAPLRDRGA